MIESLLRWARNERGYPTQIQIHLTNYCNLKCFFCPTRALVPDEDVDRTKELTTENWLRIIDEAEELGVREWHLCGGGEPMFFKDRAMAVMHKIKEYKKYGEVITNGTLFNEKMAKELVEIGWDKIIFSVDAPDRETHDELRNAKCFDTIIENVKYFVYWKKKLGINTPRLCFHMVICNKNYKKIPSMVKFAKHLGIDDLLINGLNIWTKEIEILKLNQEEEKELEEILRSAWKLSIDLRIGGNLQDFLDQRLLEKANVMNQAMTEEVERNQQEVHYFLRIPCFYPWYNIAIFPNGRTLPCFIPREAGEFYPHKSLKEIWYGEYFEHVRSELLMNKLSDDCARCNPWNFTKMNEIRKELAKHLK